MFPTNPINALEASVFHFVGLDECDGFPTNPINALEASVVYKAKIVSPTGEFPTNPINALEASSEPAAVLLALQEVVSNKSN